MWTKIISPVSWGITFAINRTALSSWEFQLFCNEVSAITAVPKESWAQENPWEYVLLHSLCAWSHAVGCCPQRDRVKATALLSWGLLCRLWGSMMARWSQSQQACTCRIRLCFPGKPLPPQQELEKMILFWATELSSLICFINKSQLHHYPT